MDISPNRKNVTLNNVSGIVKSYKNCLKSFKDCLKFSGLLKVVSSRPWKVTNSSAFPTLFYSTRRQKDKSILNIHLFCWIPKNTQ